MTEDARVALTSMAHPLGDNSLSPDSLEEIEIEIPTSAFYEECRFEAATRAMQGLAAARDWEICPLIDPKELVEDAVAMADALLAKLGISK